MRIDRPLTTRWQSMSDTARCCFAAAIGLSGVAAVGFIVNLFTSWPVAVPLLMVAGFYLVLGIGELVRGGATVPAAVTAAAYRPRSLARREQGAVLAGADALQTDSVDSKIMAAV